MSDSPVSIPPHEEPFDCPQCGTACRLEPGLCVKCLLSRGLDAEMPDGRTLDDLLDQIDVHDGG